jgi:tetratricopeptide (TPR) repeat protein
VTVGHPEGLEYTTSEGIVSAIREVGDGHFLVQTTTPISPGSSGGPLLDSRGRVVGITTLYLSQGQNLNFAVPSESIQLVMAGLRTAKQLQTVDSTLAPVALPADHVALSRLIAVYISNKHFLEADATLRAALKRYPDQLDLLAQQADLSWYQGNYMESQVAVDHMLSLDSLYVPALAGEAALLARDQDWKHAAIEAHRVLELRPADDYVANAYATLEQCATAAQQYPEALKYCRLEMLYAVGEDLMECRSRFASLLLAIGERDSANMVAEQLLSEQPPEDVKAFLDSWHLPEKIRVLSTDASWGGGNVLVIRGVVLNATDQPVSNVKVTAECVNSAGRVIATGTALAYPLELDPTATGAFTIYVEGAAKNGMRYNVRVLSWLPGY